MQSQVSSLKSQAAGASPSVLKHCPRCDRWLDPKRDFGICRSRKDGLNCYCRRCIREKIKASRARLREYNARRPKRAPAPAASHAYYRLIRKLPPTDRIVFSLKHHGPQRYESLMHTTQLLKDELGDALSRVLGRGLPVGSRNGTGPRKYFLQGNLKPETSNLKPTRPEPPLSFSTIDVLHPKTKGLLK
jgi:hypothetical protein